MILRINEFPRSLNRYIEDEIIPRYAAFDKAHQEDHARKVVQESLKLTRYYPKANRTMVYVIAAFHDLGLCGGRENHHLLSGEIVLADKRLQGWFTPRNLLIIKEAVEDHRASNQQPPRSIYGRIVAEADRIIDPEITLRRTVQYGLSGYPELDKEQQYTRFLQHLNDKYAEGGYLKLWVPQSPNATRLEELRQLIANETALRSIFEKLYMEEWKAE